MVACVYIMPESRESETIETSTVKETRVPQRRINDNMKKHCLFVLLVALVATLLHTADAVEQSICPPENCVPEWKCDSLLVGGLCPQSCDTCCSVLKPEYRTHCRHFGGECMDRCNENLQHPVVDCPPGKVCCTLV
ncbi:PREDICTED: uncharacterized protein LOC108573694 [Habropoda laboriosa]|nr:PREDICTED: uncharacterized protein LOC108573694 [Habropoda laboriosa]